MIRILAEVINVPLQSSNYQNNYRRSSSSLPSSNMLYPGPVVTLGASAALNPHKSTLPSRQRERANGFVLSKGGEDFLLTPFFKAPSSPSSHSPHPRAHFPSLPLLSESIDLDIRNPNPRRRGFCSLEEMSPVPFYPVDEEEQISSMIKSVRLLSQLTGFEEFVFII